MRLKHFRQDIWENKYQKQNLSTFSLRQTSLIPAAVDQPVQFSICKSTWRIFGLQSGILDSAIWVVSIP